MKRKIRDFMNIVIGSLGGVFIGRTLFTLLDYRMHRQIYEFSSAPWYTGILVSGVFTGAGIIIALAVKFLLRDRPGGKDPDEPDRD